MPTTLNWKQFVDAVRTMRTYQKNYTSTRNRDYLVSAKEAESKVDFMLKTMDEPDLYDRL